MRIAVISDIHSNVFALKAVMIDIGKRSVDVTVNLGDILFGPIAPKATFDLLMENECISIRGNQDRQIYDATALEIESNPTIQFIVDDLGDRPLRWMRGLPSDYQLDSDVYLCHGTPGNDLVYLLENVDSGVAQLRKDKDIILLLNGQSSEVILCGHTHTARAVRTSTEQLIVNPGSVGLPAYTDEEPVVHSMQSFSPHAMYAIVERSQHGWSIQHCKIPYQYNRAVKEAHLRNRSDWAHFLRTGRGL